MVAKPEDNRAGKSTTTQAGGFVHEEIRKVRRGQHGARSPQQAIAIVCPRQDAPALRSVRQRRAKPRRRLDEVPNTPTKRPRQTEAETAAARLACGIGGSQARTAQHRLAFFAVEAGATRCLTPQRFRSLRRGSEGVPDQGLCEPLRCSQESSPDQGSSPTVT